MKYNRELTFAEKKVNFNNLNKMGTGLSQVLDSKLKLLIPKLARREDLEKTKKQIVNIVTLIQKEAYEVGKKSAATEMKVKTPPTKKNIIEVMKKSNTQIIDKIVGDIDKSLTSKGFSEEGIVSRFVNGLKSLFVYGSINMGREVIYEQNPELIYGFQYSAILDGVTTDLCKSLDGMIVKPEDPRRQKYNPPNHWNCRSIWVEILNEEEGRPEFETKTPEDEKNIMRQYKNNADDIGIAKLTKQVIQEEKNPPEFQEDLFDTSVVQILNKDSGIVEYYPIKKGELEFYRKKIDDEIAGKNIDGKIYHITAFNPKEGFNKFVKNSDFIYKGVASKNILPK